MNSTNNWTTKYRQRSVHPELRHLAALYLVIGAIGNALGPPITGWVSDTIFPGADGVRWSLLCVTTMAGSIGVVFLAYGRRHYSVSYQAND